MPRGWWTTMNLKDHSFCWAKDTMEETSWVLFIYLFAGKRIMLFLRCHDSMGPYSKQGYIPCASWEELGFFLVSWQWLSNHGIGSALMGDDSRSGFIFQSLSLRSFLALGHMEESEWCVLETSRAGVPTLSWCSDHEGPGPLQMRSPQPCSHHSSFGSFLMRSPQLCSHRSSLEAFWMRSPHQEHFLPHVLQNVVYAV